MLSIPGCSAHDRLSHMYIETPACARRGAGTVSYAHPFAQSSRTNLPNVQCCSTFQVRKWRPGPLRDLVEEVAGETGELRSILGFLKPAAQPGWPHGLLCLLEGCAEWEKVLLEKGKIALKKSLLETEMLLVKQQMEMRSMLLDSDEMSSL